MRTRAAVLRQPETEYEIVELEVLDPGPGEVLVEMAYAGLCHSDEHLRHSNPGGRYPIVGGHEGSGVVLAVGRRRDRGGARRPRRHQLPARLRALPVLRGRAVQPLRQGRDHRHRAAARAARSRSGWTASRSAGSAWSAPSPEHTLLSEFSCVRIDAARAAGHRGAGRLQRADRLGVGGLLRRRAAGRHGRRPRAWAGWARTRCRARCTPGRCTSSGSTRWR